MDQNTNPTNSQGQQENKDAAEFKSQMGSASGTGSQPNSSDNEGSQPSVEQKTPENNSQPEPEAQSQQEQQHDWKKRYDGTAQEFKRVSEEHQRVIDTNVKLVQKKPSLLGDLAEADPNLADQVTKKAFGYDSYEAYQRAQEIEELKDSDPDKYETQKRLNTLESREQKRIESSKSKFLADKGIINNKYDTNYQKFEEQLLLLDKDFVAENPERAHEMAYNLAFPNGKPKDPTPAEKHLAEQTVKAGGNSSAPMPNANTNDRFRNPEARSFKDQFMSLAK